MEALHDEYFVITRRPEKQMGIKTDNITFHVCLDGNNDIHLRVDKKQIEKNNWNYYDVREMEKMLEDFIGI